MSSNSPGFVHFEADDLDAIIAIENASYDFPWARNIFVDCLRVGYLCIAMKLEGRIAAYTVLSVAAGEAHILNLCVASQYRGQGYGKLVLLHVLECARRLNARRCFLEVRKSNQVAINLYHSLGFNQLGERKNYYPGVNGREDAVTYAIEFVDDSHYQ